MLRVKRVRNPDVVAIEVLEKFLRDAAAAGLTVLLAGVRGDLLAAIERVGISRYLPAEQVFAEEDEEFSATLKAVRRAYALRAGDGDTSSTAVFTVPAGGAYYLV